MKRKQREERKSREKTEWIKYMVMREREKVDEFTDDVICW